MRINLSEGKIVLSLTTEEIDAQTQVKIRTRYSESEEYKIHRLALEAIISNAAIPQVYLDYQNYIKQCINEGKVLKNSNNL